MPSTYSRSASETFWENYRHSKIFIEPVKMTVLEKVQQLWTRSNYYNNLPKKVSKVDLIKTKKHPNLYYKDPRAKW